MKKFTTPNLRNDFIIVVNSEKDDLAACAISYLFQSNSYLPMFTFRKVDVALNSPVTRPDIYAIQRKQAYTFSLYLENAIIESGGCENLIFLGLTEEQKSYLIFSGPYNILDIQDHQDIEQYLGGFGYDKNEVLECSEEQVIHGLCQALKENRTLKIGASNHELMKPTIEDYGGVVVIESAKSANVIASINYTYSIGANIILVDGLAEEEDVLYLIERWQSKEQEALDKLKEKINVRLAGINFNSYDFAAFFTRGLPYTLCLSHIPTSHISLKYRPDFFVFNSFIFEKRKELGSAVIFSPMLFRDEETNQPIEETSYLISLLEFENFYLRKLLDNSASTYNLKNTVESYPFDLLHICSHGGDVDGTNCMVEFQDTQNVKHTVEFDHVFTMALTPYVDKHTVESLYYFKAVNGLKWRSDELKAKSYSKEFFASLEPIISKAFSEKTVFNRQKVPRVPNANAIKCKHFNYHANFEQIGGFGTHPIIFNNSCWSWMNVSSNFLLSGARGYIGTLRQVLNDKAMRFAKVFYANVFETNIINAFHKANTDFLVDCPDSIYIFWGVHFSTLKNLNTVDYNRIEVMKQLRDGVAAWEDEVRTNKGNRRLLAARIGDTKWMLKDIIKGDKIGHLPD